MNKFFFLFLVCASYSVINAQEISFVSEAMYGKSKSLPRKYRSVALKFGPRFLDTDPGKIVTSFSDDSPATDFFDSSVDIKDSYQNIGIQFAYEWRKYSGINHSIFFDGSLTGSAKTFLFGYSLGWNIPVTESLIVRPAFGVMLGNNVFSLGQIENTTGYIQVNQTQFNDDLVDVSLKGDISLYSPEITVRYIPAENFHILLNINYDIGDQNNSPKLVFESTSGEDLRDDKEIDSTNPNVTYNGTKLTTMPYKVGGLRLSLGAAYVWPRD